MIAPGQATGYVSQGERTGAAQVLQDNNNIPGQLERIYNKEEARNAAKEADKAKRDQAIAELGDGGWWAHRETTLNDLFQSYQQEGMNHLKNGIDWNDPANREEYQRNKMLQYELNKYNKMSEGYGQMFEETYKKLIANPEKYTEESKDRLYAAVEVPPDQWSKFDWANVLQERPEELDWRKELDDMSKAWPTKNLEAVGTYENGFVKWTTPKISNRDGFIEAGRKYYFDKVQPSMPGKEGYATYMQYVEGIAPYDESVSKTQISSPYRGSGSGLARTEQEGWVKQKTLEIGKQTRTDIPKMLINGRLGKDVIIDAEYATKKVNGESVKGVLVTVGSQVGQVFDPETGITTGEMIMPGQEKTGQKFIPLTDTYEFYRILDTVYKMANSIQEGEPNVNVTVAPTNISEDN